MRSYASRQYRVVPACVLAAAFAFAVSASAGTARLSPSSATFESTSEVHTFTLVDAAGHVASDAVSSVKIMASEHDYDHFFDVTVSEGKVEVKPTGSLEVGSYDLVIATSAGTARASLLSPLNDMEGSIEHRAKELGVSVDEVKALMGLSSPLGREHLDLNIPPVYYLGQTMTVPVAADEGREYHWHIDGRLADSGHGSHAFEHTFTETGLFGVVYVEYQDGKPVAGDMEVVRVVPEFPVASKVNKGTQTRYEGPTGYSEYTWMVDGVKVSDARTLSRDFAETGTHTITCVATGPEHPDLQTFRKITYTVTVL